MSKFKDERLNSEMKSIQAKLFVYMFCAFAIIFVLKKLFIEDYGGLEQGLDNFLLISTAVYAGYLEFSSKTDFYRPTKFKRMVIGSIAVGLAVMLIPIFQEGFYSGAILAYVLAFLNGVVFCWIMYLIVGVISKFRHKQHEAKLDELDD